MTEHLTPTEHLVCETLAARLRLGEQCWSFDTRLRRQLKALVDKGYVREIKQWVPEALVAFPTDKLREDFLMPGYQAPAGQGTPLWEVQHPYLPAEGATVEHDSFAELAAALDDMDEDYSFVYRWDWFDAAAAHNDELFLPGEPRTRQELTVTILMQRKCRIVNHTCPVTHADEPAVRAWLSSDRVAGALRRTWAPILD